MTRLTSSVLKPIAEGRRDAGQERDVVKLAHHAFDPDPMGHVAAGEVDHGEAAARLGVARRERLVEREAGEGPVLARQRQADDRA